MIDKKFITSLFAMLALAYGILEIKSYLNDNLIENNTPVKEAVNRFLNGETS